MQISQQAVVAVCLCMALQMDDIRRGAAFCIHPQPQQGLFAHLPGRLGIGTSQKHRAAMAFDVLPTSNDPAKIQAKVTAA